MRSSEGRKARYTDVHDLLVTSADHVRQIAHAPPYGSFFARSPAEKSVVKDVVP